MNFEFLFQSLNRDFLISIITIIITFAKKLCTYNKALKQKQNYLSKKLTPISHKVEFWKIFFLESLRRMSINLSNVSSLQSYIDIEIYYTYFIILEIELSKIFSQITLTLDNMFYYLIFYRTNCIGRIRFFSICAKNNLLLSFYFVQKQWVTETTMPGVFFMRISFF